ncbi:MAG: glycosyltransferase family 4 protein [Candidatus Diapherotrites archaeon]
MNCILLSTPLKANYDKLSDMKIAHVTHHFWPCIGGIENSVKTLCTELSKRGHICKVICLNKCGNKREKLKQYDNYKGTAIVRLPFVDLSIYKIAFGTLKHIRDCDIIHIHGIGFFSDYLLITKFLHKKPVVISTHGGIFHTGKNLLKSIYFYFWCRLILRLADKVVAVSENDLRQFQEILPQKKLEHITVPFNLKGFKPGKKCKNTFIFVGRLSKNKNLPKLISVFAFASKKSKATLYIAGEEFDEKIKDLKELVKKEGAEDRIKILGRCSDKKLKEMLSKCDFFISASSHEGFGISVIEAMKAGCIPVLNKIPTFEGFIKNGENGFIVDFNDVESCVSKINEIIELEELEKEKMRKRATEFASSFSSASIAKKLEKLYKKVLEP